MESVAFLFPGQGSQKSGMLKDLAKEINQAETAAIKAALPYWEDMLETEDPEKLKEWAAVLVFLSGYLSAQALKKLGVRPKAFGGFSLGEITALTQSGAFDLATGLELVELRRQAMARASLNNPGGMQAVMGLDRRKLTEALEPIEDVWPVNFNAPDQIVISGQAEALKKAQGKVKELGGKVIPLRVAGAFHSPYMEPVVEVLENFLEPLPKGSLTVPVYGNQAGVIYTEDNLVAELSHQVARPVEFVRQIEAMYADGVRIFVETGYGNTLQKLTQKILGPGKALVLGCSNGEEARQVAAKIKEYQHV